MTEHTRRSALATIGASFVAGCSGLSSTPTASPEPPDQDGDGVKDSLGEYPNDGSRSEQITSVQETVTLNPGDFKSYRVDAADEFRVVSWQVNVNAKELIDSLVMPKESYQTYINDGDDWQYSGTYSRKSIANFKAEPQLLPKETWFFVLDYTREMTAPGPQRIDVDVTLEVANYEG